MTDTNPFVYARPVAPDDLIDRREELESLLGLAEGGHHTRLTAPRRYGKTSLIRAMLSRAANRGMAPVYVNLYGILSVEDAVARLESTYSTLRGPLGSIAEGLLRTLRPTVSLPGVSLSPEVDPAAAGRLLALLDLPRKVHGRSGRRVLVAFDEFQEALAPRVPLDGLVRSVIEQHGEEAAYVFAGSHPGMMARLFSDRERPFYGQARPIELGPLAEDDLAVHLSERFAAADRPIDEVVGCLLDSAAGHPQRAMILAHHLFEQLPAGAEATELSFLAALDSVRQELGEAFERSWRALDDGERRTLAAVAAGGGRPTRAGALAAGDVARSTALDALTRLADAGQIRPDGDRWLFVDPLFEDWVARGRSEA